MTRTKGSPDRSNKVKRGYPTPPSLPPKLKQRMVEAQLKLMERSLDPIDVEFDISTLAGIMKLNHSLIELSFDRVLSSHDVGAISRVVTNQIQMLMPSEMEAKIDEVLQQTKDAREDIAALKRSGSDKK